MKKHLIILGIVTLGLAVTLLFPSNAQAKGEVFEYTRSSADNGLGGDQITAGGDNSAFKSKTIFTKVSDSVADKHGAKISGYSIYYRATSFNLRNDATMYPACRTEPAFIALKSDGATKGKLYPAPMTADGVTTSCGPLVGMRLENLASTNDQYILSDEHTIKPDSSHVSTLDGYYAALAGPLGPLKNAYYESLGSRAPCSSQGCNDSTWKTWVTQCWERARADAARSAALTGQAGGTYDSEAGTKDNFSTCLAGKINNASVATAAQIKDLLKTTSTASVNQAGGDAGQEARDELDDAIGGGAGDGATEGTSCAIEGVGWIVCPILNFIAGITDAIYKIIEQFLQVNPATVANGGGTYQAWTVMRTIANVLLIIAFLFIVYSQLTGMGVSNYGVKKTLPRLIVVAILINVSFFICQIAVDLSNILGASLKSFLSELPVFPAQGGNWVEQTLGQGNFFTNAAMAILAGQASIAIIAGVAATGYFLGIGIFIPVVLAAIAAIIITFFILLARQMLVVVLVVIAPVAIAAMLLPNLERWSKWWQKAFVGVLVIYPLIAVLFGGSQLAANILVQANMKDLGWQLAAAAIAIVPLFLTPALLKGSLNAIPAIGNIAQKLQARAVGSTRSGTAKGMKKLGEYSAASNNRFGKGISGLIHGNGRMGRLRQASAQRAYEEPRMKDLMLQWTKAGKNGEPAIADDFDKLAEIAEKSPSSFEGQAAISMLASKNEAVGLSKLRKKFEGDPQKMAAYNKAIASNYGALKAKHPGAVQTMDSKAWASVKQADMQTMKDAALEEGVAASPEFRSTLATAMQDPEQERHFTRAMYSAMNITPPSKLTEQAAQTTQSQQSAQSSQQSNGAAGTSASDPTAQQAGAGPGTPGNTATAAQRAQQTARQAAQGTAGTTPFVVGSDRTVTAPSTEGTMNVPHDNSPTPPAGS